MADAFRYDGGTVQPGETDHFRFQVSETYLGDPIRVPVSIINGEEAGPTAFLSAAVHGDELNGIQVVRELSTAVSPADIEGTLVCLPVINVYGFLVQQRYLPVYDRDMNRAFPGSDDSTSAKRIAQSVYDNFIDPADFGLDFHTSTRGRTNMFQVRADTDDDGCDRLARAFGTNVIIDNEGPDGSLRTAATESGTPTITVEMGEAQRFQRDLIDRAIDGVESVLAHRGMRPQSAVKWPGWRTLVEDDGERTWLRADDGGIVEMHHERGALVREGEVVCTITDPFGTDGVAVEAPFTGVLVGVLETPVVYPGNPLCHIATVDEETADRIERQRS
jgi:hypothetical protein